MFIEELQAHREKGGLTQEVLAQKALMSLSLLKKIEIGNRRPQRDFALWCDDFFATPGTFERFHRLTLLEMFPEWFATRMLYEEEATVITEWDMRVVPGLLQTREYTEAIIRACRPLDPEQDLLRDIEARMERQEILHRENPPKLWVLLAEGLLHQEVGGPDVMRGQLERLIEFTRTPQCVLQILPFKTSDAPGGDGPATIFEFADRSPIAYIEGWEVGWVIDAPERVTRIATTHSMIKSCALTPADSRDLLFKIRDEL